MSRKRLAEYTSFAANDIHMDHVGQTRVLNNGRPRTAAAAATAAAVTREYDDDDVFQEESSETLVTRPEAVVVPNAAFGLGDEPSAAWSPKYRDEPDSARIVTAPRSGRHES